MNLFVLEPLVFTVEGDPVPYLRMTQGQVKLMQIPNYRLKPAQLKVKEKVKRYHAWKDFVLGHALSAGGRYQPFLELKKVRLDVDVYYREHRADPDNVRKGIQDALFPKRDSHVYGCVDWFIAKENPRCVIRLSE